MFPTHSLWIISNKPNEEIWIQRDFLCMGVGFLYARQTTNTSRRRTPNIPKVIRQFAIISADNTVVRIRKTHANHQSLLMWVHLQAFGSVFGVFNFNQKILTYLHWPIFFRHLSIFSRSCLRNLCGIGDSVDIGSFDKLRIQISF